VLVPLLTVTISIWIPSGIWIRNIIKDKENRAQLQCCQRRGPDLDTKVQI